jgi:hypothetical protein
VIELNDYKLERSDDDAPIATPPSPRSTNYALWGGVIVAALLVGGGIWYITSQRQPAPAADVVSEAAAPSATAPPAPEAPLVSVADIDLPPLAQTDPVVRELVARLSSHPTVVAWLTTKGLIANFTVVTLNIAEGRTPARFLRPIAPRGRFRTAGAGELLVDPRSYDRYNFHADAVTAIDSRGAAILYLTLKPRITDAYRELGYPDGDFDRVLERAMGVLLQTPTLDERVALSPKGVTYAYADPKLESLSPAQKQLLRLGPRNAAAIRAKLQEVAALLRLHPEGTN